MPSEYKTFDAAMDTILRADPAKVKAEMDADKQQRAEDRGKKHAQAAEQAFKKAGKAMKDNPKLQVPY